jgi:hypothetical protein
MARIANATRRPSGIADLPGDWIERLAQVSIQSAEVAQKHAIRNAKPAMWIVPYYELPLAVRWLAWLMESPPPAIPFAGGVYVTLLDAPLPKPIAAALCDVQDALRGYAGLNETTSISAAAPSDELKRIVDAWPVDCSQIATAAATLAAHIPSPLYDAARRALEERKELNEQANRYLESRRRIEANTASAVFYLNSAKPNKPNSSLLFPKGPVDRRLTEYIHFLDEMVEGRDRREIDKAREFTSGNEAEAQRLVAHHRTERNRGKVTI